MKSVLSGWSKSCPCKTDKDVQETVSVELLRVGQGEGTEMRLQNEQEVDYQASEP